ncbi:hypothetical protein A6P39_002660 [Streptomyces sp. FXJ1.172]|uniref:hypothetical protein n=1 Tax=Streptomyces sp. FXJ1.172 TaxID=710705 RepID=UPI00082BE2B2|nr:hypothetical protein [Streptomyces sp. FXJ1.172]WEO93060.1 hypothetical protein A6P39_002660 [Streptomyces sp. FXJ1.172]
MTPSPRSIATTPWVLEITIAAARAADEQWDEQRNKLRSLAQYDPKTHTWWTRIGALDLAGIERLQSLLDVARIYGTHVTLTPVKVPSNWPGPVFTDNAEIANIVNAHHDENRAIGELPLP